MTSTADLLHSGQDFVEGHKGQLSALGHVAGRMGDVLGGMFSVLARIQALLGKAAEKPYQARLLEARINSCRALLSSLDSRINAVHLEPLRIKLENVETIVENAGTRFHVYALTDESLARSFEQASAALQEEETTLALVAHALPKTKGLRGRSTSASRARRRRSRSSSSHRSTSHGRSTSPAGFEDADADVDVQQPQLGPVPEASGELTPENAALLKQVRVRALDFETASALLTSSAVDPLKACMAGESPTGRPKVEKPETEGMMCSPEPVELPLPNIDMVERESNTFWQDSVTLVFRCAASGHQHRVTTQQFSGSAGGRLVSWVGTPSWANRTWEEEMEEDVLSPTARAELKDLLVKSGWYDKFRFDASCGKGEWVLNEVADAGYEPCSTDH